MEVIYVVMLRMSICRGCMLSVVNFFYYMPCFRLVVQTALYRVSGRDEVKQTCISIKEEESKEAFYSPISHQEAINVCSTVERT